MAERTRARRRLWSRVACGLGGAFNGFRKHFNASYCFIFYMNVIRLPSGQTGLIRFTGKISGLCATLLFGYLCDKVDIPYISRRLGRRKAWHLLTTILLAVLFLMDYSRCSVCESGGAVMAYHLVGQGVGMFLYSASDIAHLSIIPVIAQTEDEAVVLNSFR